MAGELGNTVSPVKCNEKPWDLWVSEIGRVSPRPDDAVDGKSRRGEHPYKGRYRRAGINRLRHDTMSLHGLLPQMDNLNAAVCHMCGKVVKCSAVYRHLMDQHTEPEPCLPPPAAPTVKLKALSRSRHKKDVPPVPLDMLPKMETSPVHTATAPLSRIILPQPEMYLDEASTSTGVTGEVQVCVESGELPVVSIQDSEDLRLGDNLTDDIFAIMNSEGIQSADDITNAADWKNIIRDIGNMQEINFSQTTESQSQDMYTAVDTTSLTAYTLADTDLTNLQFAPNTSPMLTSVVDTSNVNILNVNTQALKPAAPSQTTPSTPSTKSQRSKTSKTTSKFHLREYDPNKHCGVTTAENLKPCTRSLTCKAHALSLRRMVEGRLKPFDVLLAEHRAAKDPNSAAAAAAAAPAPVAPPMAVVPPLQLVNTSIDLSAFNGFTADQQVSDIYTLLNVEDPTSVLPDTSSITSLLSQPLPADLLLPDDATISEVPVLSIASPVDPVPPRIPEKPDDGPPPLIPSDVCWYTSCPRPLALCTFNASHAGGAVTLGKKFATVRSNIKSSLTRSQKSTGGVNTYYYNQNALSMSKSVHMNASKTNKPEVRKLIVTCSGTSGNGNKSFHSQEACQSLSELLGGESRVVNGHMGPSGLERRHSSSLKQPRRPTSTVLDLGFSLDPLLADEKC